jgi:HEAT repeat protein
VEHLERQLRAKDPLWLRAWRRIGIQCPAKLKRWVWRLVSRPDSAANRAQAARALALLGADSAAALPALERALADPDVRVSNAAAQTLAEMGPAAIPALVRTLDSGNAQANNHAVFALASLGTNAHAAIPALARLARQGPIADPRQPAYALGKIGPAAVPMLAELLADTNAAMRALAAYALGIVIPPAKSAFTAVVERTADPATPVRLAALESMTRIAPGHASVVGVCLRALGDPDAEVRAQSAQFLCRISHRLSNAVPVLALRLENDESPAVRSWLASLLGLLGPAAQPALPTLTNALTDPDPSVRAKAAQAIERVAPGSGHTGG